MQRKRFPLERKPLFDKSPREWTRKPSAIARRKRLIAMKAVFDNLRFSMP